MDKTGLFRAELGGAADGSDVPLNGRVNFTPKLASKAEAAMRDLGLTRSDQFVYIDPWLDNRRDPTDNGPWFDLVLITIAGLGVLYQLGQAFRISRHNRRVMSVLSRADAAKLKGSMRVDARSGNILLMLIIAGVIAAYIISSTR